MNMMSKINKESICFQNMTLKDMLETIQKLIEIYGEDAWFENYNNIARSFVGVWVNEERKKEMTAQKWKYEVIRYAASYRDSKIELLDKKGQEGWELVNAHYLPGEHSRKDKK